MKHEGNFATGGNYGARFVLEDGTPVNVVTIFTGPGLAAGTSIEADRPLTEEELDEVLDADACLDHAKGKQITYEPLAERHYF